MSRQFQISDEAERELRKARQYLDDQREGLGEEFREEVGLVFARIEESPEGFRLFRNGIRRALVDRFHYFVYYVFDEAKITILVVVHQKRDPAYLDKRLAEEQDRNE